jgi:hypothetical protein
VISQGIRGVINQGIRGVINQGIRGVISIVRGRAIILVYFL